MKKNTLDFFIKRIGKKVYRDKVSCGCDSCVDGFKNGVMIHDVQQAEYLKVCSDELGIVYRDKP